MKIYRLAWKHAQDGTYLCGHCFTSLIAKDVTYNPRHHFNPGQLYYCSCGKSRVWANSVRYPEELMDYCDGKEVVHHRHPESWGFCNDEYCPYCWQNFHPLDNTYADNNKNTDIRDVLNKIRGTRHNAIGIDIYGCLKCSDNQRVIFSGNKLGEKEGQVETAKWYKDHQGLWRSKVEGEIKSSGFQCINNT